MEGILRCPGHHHCPYGLPRACHVKQVPDDPRHSRSTSSRAWYWASPASVSLPSDQISSFFADLGLIFLLFFVGLGLKVDKIADNSNAVLTSGIIDLNVNMLIGFLAAYLLGFSFVEALIIAAAFYISSTAMAVTSLIENRKLMMRESEAIIWLMVFEDLVMIIVLALLSAGNQNLFFFAGKIFVGLGVLYILAHYGKEFLVSILDREDELPVLFTFVAVLATAGCALYLGIPDTLMVIALGAAIATTDPMRSSSMPGRSRMFSW